MAPITEEGSTFETSAYFYKVTQRHTAEGCHRHILRLENMKSHFVSMRALRL
jgi:hypothetical protein